MNHSTTTKNLISFLDSESFKGWDPYDGLNSKLISKIGLFKIPIIRLIFIQAFKKSPINLRKIFMVPKGSNPKGVALCLNAFCNLHSCSESVLNEIGLTKSDCYKYIVKLSDRLIQLSSKGYKGSCWGYDFDWQARLLFLFPKNTPNIVCTAYSIEALINSYKITNNQRYLDYAISSGDFVLKDINRKTYGNGHIFSYSPLDGNNTVYNASLMGAKILAHCYKYTGHSKYKKNSEDAVAYCIDIQNQDGSWYYGGLKVQKWIDSYHTAYNLESLNVCKELLSLSTINNSIEKGLKFYMDNFFLDDGTPKYYHDKIYPIDIHSPAQLFVLLCRLNKLKQNRKIVDKVSSWTYKYMLSKKGYFYYQKNRFYTIKIPYFRWSQAFMLNALSYLLKAENE